MGDARGTLVIGALGQIGSELTQELRRRLGNEMVVASDIKHPDAPPDAETSGPFTLCDVTDSEQLARTLDAHDVGTVYHMAAILSATGEKKPAFAWHVNSTGLMNVLEAARQRQLRVYCPSSIAVFGPDAIKEDTPQDSVLHPTTMYGVSKVAGELLCSYYAERYAVDVRGIRYPGIISHETLPGGGTTDYAVAIFYEALRQGRYTCFVGAETVLPMMYMDDCVRATIELMEAPRDRLTCQASYNLAAVSFSVAELVAAIRQHMPQFECIYQPDERQQFADSWPRSIDDSVARRDWGWQPRFGLEDIVGDMLTVLRVKLGQSAATGGR